MELALLKKAYLITMSNGGKETVLLEGKPDRSTMIQERHVVILDWIVINASYITSVKEVELNEDYVDWAMAYAKSLKWGFKAVACERVRSYEETNGKMPILKLKSRLQNFIESGKSEDRLDKRYQLYISAGGNPEEIL